MLGHGTDRVGLLIGVVTMSHSSAIVTVRLVWASLRSLSRREWAGIALLGVLVGLVGASAVHRNGLLNQEVPPGQETRCTAEGGHLVRDVRTECGPGPT